MAELPGWNVYLFIESHGAFLAVYDYAVMVSKVSSANISNHLEQLRRTRSRYGSLSFYSAVFSCDDALNRKISQTQAGRLRWLFWL
jgi:hypothetical protein